MRRREFVTSLSAVTAWPLASRAEQPRKVHRIGWLTAQRAASLTPYVAAFRSSLAELGYVEGQNLAIEFRYADDAIERVPELAAELVRLPVDVIVAQGAAVFVLSKLGQTVPIVYVYSGDPVTAGFAESLTRPHGNMTGLTFMAAEFSGKRLELLKEMIPQLRRVAVIANPEHHGEHIERGYSEATGKRLGLIIDYFPTRTRDELSGAFKAMASRPPQAISVFADGFAIQNRERIVEFGNSQRAPVISGWAVFARSGATCTYGPRLAESYKRLAHYADRVLKGTKPGNLPIEQPTHFELIVNLRAAKALGLTIPESVIVRADEVIE